MPSKRKVTTGPEVLDRQRANRIAEQLRRGLAGLEKPEWKVWPFPPPPPPNPGEPWVNAEWDEGESSPPSPVDNWATPASSNETTPLASNPSAAPSLAQSADPPAAATTTTTTTGMALAADPTSTSTTTAADLNADLADAKEDWDAQTEGERKAKHPPCRWDPQRKAIGSRRAQAGVLEHLAPADAIAPGSQATDSHGSGLGGSISPIAGPLDSVAAADTTADTTTTFTIITTADDLTAAISVAKEEAGLLVPELRNKVLEEDSRASVFLYKNSLLVVDTASDDNEYHEQSSEIQRRIDEWDSALATIREARLSSRTTI
ncbi:hypothetical protein H072_5822 [Dactylellina haptotyla CBS 200.50]|uniref:Uncharacterized protein n=1 Tax=Dactylellina haptotyla (strain CBS 200.50) TaxID=1284197 RepID=S8ABP2_DACHA|nr:hypothetical protein H072_5822 [Dactylellina haptotyla CBS 200.50]